MQVEGRDEDDEPAIRFWRDYGGDLFGGVWAVRFDWVERRRRAATAGDWSECTGFLSAGD
jgi:hypothetical protein